MSNLEEKYLLEWCNEKDIDRNMIDFKGYTIMKKSTTLGETYPYPDGHCVVKLSLRILKYETLRYGVLWHEFCHCWNHIKKEGSGHDGSWWAKYLTKPKFVIYSGLLNFALIGDKL